MEKFCNPELYCTLKVTYWSQLKNWKPKSKKLNNQRIKMRYKYIYIFFKIILCMKISWNTTLFFQDKIAPDTEKTSSHTFNQQQYFVGDFVYAEISTERGTQKAIFLIENIFTDKISKEQKIYANQFFRYVTCNVFSFYINNLIWIWGLLRF